MRSPLKWLSALGLALAIAALALTFAAVARQPARPPPLTLPSGETLILRGVTYGTNHLAPGISRWLRLLPTSLRQRLPARFMTASMLFSDRTTSEPQLLMWIEVNAGAATNRPSTNVWLMLQDEQGRTAGRREDLFLWPQNPRAGHVAAFRAFPRRGMHVGVTFIQGSSDKPVIVGHWRIPNPARNQARSWETEPLPLTRTNGDLECTLEEVVAGTRRNLGVGTAKNRRARLEMKTAKPGEEPGAAFSAIFRERGIATNAWTFGSITLADATGNVLSSSTSGWSQSSNTVFFHWSPVLWPEEGWELRLQAKRSSQFPSDETATFTNLFVPGFDNPVDLNDEIQVGGVTLRTKQFVLRKRPDPHRWSSEEVSRLTLTVSGLTNGVFLDPIKATDEQGGIHRCGSWGGSSSSGGPTEFSFSFPDMTNEVKRLSFAFAIQRGRPFTFRFKPESVSTNISLLPKQ